MLGTIGFPSLHGEPPGCVAAEEQVRVRKKSEQRFLVFFLCRLNLTKSAKTIKAELYIKVLDRQRFSTSLTLYYLEFFLQAVHLGPQGVNNVLPVFQHEVFQLLRGLHLLNVLQNDKKQRKKRKN